MSIQNELAALFHRDLTRVVQQLAAFEDQKHLWERVPGIANSAGNLVLHLEGNLRDFVGRVLGGVPYQRVREEEFAGTGVAAADLTTRMEEVRGLVARVIGGLSEEQLGAMFPENPMRKPMSTRQFLVHLNGHLNYHLGQIDYLRRHLSGGRAIDYATL